MNVGRNDPCPCGSGKKYKHCCYAKDSVKHEEPIIADQHVPSEDEADEDDGSKHESHKHGKGRDRFRGDQKGGGNFKPRVFRGSQRGN